MTNYTQPDVERNGLRHGESGEFIGGWLRAKDILC